LPLALQRLAVRREALKKKKLEERKQQLQAKLKKRQETTTAVCGGQGWLTQLLPWRSVLLPHPMRTQRPKVLSHLAASHFSFQGMKMVEVELSSSEESSSDDEDEEQVKAWRRRASAKIFGFEATSSVRRGLYSAAWVRGDERNLAGLGFRGALYTKLYRLTTFFSCSELYAAARGHL
jgi:hypothetical protein